MVAVFSWQQRYGAANGYTEVSANNLNLVNTYTTPNADSATYPITAGENSYELWVRPHFKGTWNTIDGIKFGLVGGALLSGEAVYCGWIQPTGQSYQTPVKINSTIAVSSIPSGGASCYIGISGSITTQMISTSLDNTSGQWGDWIVLQLRTSSNIPAGATNTKTFSISYTET